MPFLNGWDAASRCVLQSMPVRRFAQHLTCERPYSLGTRLAPNTLLMLYFVFFSPQVCQKELASHRIEACSAHVYIAIKSRTCARLKSQFIDLDVTFYCHYEVIIFYCVVSKRAFQHSLNYNKVTKF
jgi:hypothetical protein